MKTNASDLLTIIGLLFVITGSTTLVVRFIGRKISTTTRPAVKKCCELSVPTVLKAHISSCNAHWTRFTQKATLREDKGVSSNQIETSLSLSTDGTQARYDRTTAALNLSYLLNQKTLIRTTVYAGSQREVKTVNSDDEAYLIEFQIETFGILPLLKRLSNPATRVAYVGNTSKGDQFEVKTGYGSWYFYVNSQHLIDRLQFDELTITFDDYRQVEGLNLPFHQTASKGDDFLHEIRFSEIDLDPAFASDVFKR
jgi:hypothetical protein